MPACRKLWCITIETITNLKLFYLCDSNLYSLCKVRLRYYCNKNTQDTIFNLHVPSVFFFCCVLCGLLEENFFCTLGPTMRLIMTEWVHHIVWMTDIATERLLKIATWRLLCSSSQIYSIHIHRYTVRNIVYSILYFVFYYSSQMTQSRI